MLNVLGVVVMKLIAGLKVKNNETRKINKNNIILMDDPLLMSYFIFFRLRFNNTAFLFF